MSARARTEADATEKEAALAQGDVIADLKGAVRLRDGVAQFSDIRFSIPGAVANGGGTYHLITKRVNLNGKVAMEATVSEASGGFKSFLLKPLNVFFRNKQNNAGAVLPVTVTGIYPRAKFGISLTGGRKDND